MNTTVLIGSSAIKHWFPEFREPRDVDYFSEIKIGNAECFWHPSLNNWNFGKIATVDEIYTIKISHAFWELHGTWDKHMFDTVYLRSKGAEFLPELYAILYPIWEETHGKKKANLEATPEEFFNSNVYRLYDHDSIHESIAYYEKPLFDSILRDGHQVAVDMKKFEALPQQDKLRLVREEVYATALERQLIPQEYKGSVRAAYMWALRRTVTSFSKGWFPLFIVLNFDDLRRPEIDFVKKHRENVALLRPFQ